jgi:hypothetical protein
MSPYCMAMSAGMTPTQGAALEDLVANGRSSISSQKLRSFFIACLHSVIHPAEQILLSPRCGRSWGGSGRRWRLDQVEDVLTVAEGEEHRE